MAETLINGTTLVESVKKLEVKSTIDNNVHDFTTGNFTTDGTYRSLDISEIVPQEAEWIIISIEAKDGVAGSQIQFNGGGIDSTNRLVINTQAANISEYETGWIKVNSSRLLWYKGDNLAFTTILLKIIGYI